MSYETTAPMDWTTLPLAKLVVDEAISYGVVQPGPSTAGGVPIIRVNNFRGYGLDIADVHRVAPDIESKHSRTRLRTGDVLLTVVGSVGQVAIAGDEVNGWNLARAVALIRPANPSDSRWIALVLRSPRVQRALLSRANTTVQTTINLKDLKELEIPMPPLEERRNIEALLGAIDDAIEQLRAANTTLQELASTLYRKWFVEYDLSDLSCASFSCGRTASNSTAQSRRSAVPEGWRIGHLGDVMHQRNERAQPSAVTESRPYVPLECIVGKSIFLGAFLHGSEAKSSLVTFRKGDILFGAMRAYFHKVCRAPFDGTTRSTTFVLVPREGFSAFALMCAFDGSTVAYAASHSEGTTIPYAKWRGVLERKSIAIPPREVAEAFDHAVSPLLDAGEANIQRISVLEDLRDSLLPGLTCGALRFPAQAGASLYESK
jgi:type I restriction enzyme, S subunit